MRKENDLKRLTRIVKLLNILSEGKLVVSDIATELNVSTRTIQRDIKAMEEAGFPIYDEKPGQKRFLKTFSLKKAKLTDEEASMLVLMSDIIKPLGAKFNTSFSTLKNKVLNANEESLFYIKLHKGPPYKETVITKTLERSIHEKTWVNMTLTHDPSRKLEYQLRPLKIINYDGFWYLLGINLFNKKKTIRLDNILEVASTDKTFKVREDIIKTLEQSPNVWFGEKKDIKVVVKVFPEVAHYFKAKEVFPMQKTTKEWKDGSLTIESHVSNHREAIQIIMQWVPYISIIQPKDLRLKIQTLLKEGLCKI